ncbi:hypothetical protein F9802_06370 [Bacillus aerolatus]|uniref:Uncharacterized protein n=1 Tax=Bacillus aerolatus TaxID=2653354 RepID=A0A6I1FGM8_9BACI|nr:hypothetical protein [Bacillus aerolatus]KAB7707372.1 hypothetical protein F9802_06370 [Bacillus aerolatus]
MRRLRHFFVIGISLFVLVGCGFDGSKVHEVAEDLISDKEIGKYVDELTFFDTEKGQEKSVIYNLELDANDEFDTLSQEEKANFFSYVNELLWQKSGGSTVDCDEDYECTVDSIVIKTLDHTYTVSYLPTSNHQMTAYKEDGEYVFLKRADVLNETITTEVVEQEEPSETAEELPVEEVVVEDTNVYPDTNLSTADGDDWMQLTSSQKTAMIEEAIHNLESNGGIVLEGSDWFIDALDAFYGDEITNSTLVTEIFAMAGVGGGVIIND